MSPRRRIISQMARLHQRLIDEEDEEQLIFLFRETKRLKEVCVPSGVVCVNIHGRKWWNMLQSSK